MLPRRHLSQHTLLCQFGHAALLQPQLPRQTPRRPQSARTCSSRGHFRKLHQTGLSWLTIANHFHPQIAAKRREWGGRTHPPQTILLPPLSDSDRTVEQDTKQQFLIEVVQPAIFTRIRLPNSLPLHPTKAVSSTETSPRVLPTQTLRRRTMWTERRRGDGDSASVATNNQTGLSSGEGGCNEATAENEDDELAETRRRRGGR
ncbi:hypothetical protein BLNAU_1420 [Blattamonas nauphoetae]|uniref:Uncharacterized protein n=1 Tax=Blattamonas nauphoetae TaxID=2049346 RepID=A0ABQ9YHZ1_9EUKA|nr:hypothetical protein BLNAU_1420 [Blattamonas nauphoetae]